MTDLLKQFHSDEAMRDAVLEYLKAYLREIAADRAFARKDTTDIATAYETIKQSFAKLNEMYGKDRAINNPNRAT